MGPSTQVLQPLNHSAGAQGFRTLTMGHNGSLAASETRPARQYFNGSWRIERVHTYTQQICRRG